MDVAAAVFTEKNSGAFTFPVQCYGAVTAAYLFSPDFLDDAAPRSSEPGRAAARRAADDAARDHAFAVALSGDDEMVAHAALGALVSAYFERLARFAYGLVGSADVAEDVVQDVLVRVWDARRTIRPDQALRAYLFTAVRRRALDVLKHRGVEERHALAAVPREPAMITVDADLDADALAAAVRVAIARLPERRQTALRLRYEESLPFALVAEVMGTSEKAAKDLVARAVKDVRRHLGV